MEHAAPLAAIASAVPPGFFGPLVVVVRTLMDGTVTREAMPAALAVLELEQGAQNGVTVSKAHIEWGAVLDRWSFSR